MGPQDERFGPERRIKKRAEFLAIQSGGKKIHSKHFLLIIGSTSTNQRLGVTITTKVHKRAVRRNRLRRRVREIFRKERKDFSQTCDLVIIAKQQSTELEFEALKTEIRSLFYRAKLYKKK